MGNRRKVSMAAAFIGRPELVILDEPTNGIDTAGILALKEYMERICTQGSIVTVSSHVLDFIDKVADQYICLKDGNIAALGSN